MPIIKRHSAIVTLGVITTLSVTYALWLYWTPFMDDDLNYMGWFKSYIDGDSGVSLWDSFTAMLSDQWLNGNIRLPNMITSVTHTIIPKWLLATLNGVCAWLLMHWTITLSNARGKLPSTIIVIAMIVFLLPWHAFIGIPVYAQSYIMPSALMLLFFKIWVNDKHLKGTGTYIGVIILGILTGESHEGASLPILCGIALFWLTNYSKITRRQIIMTVALICGTLVLLSAQGKTARVEPSFLRPIEQWIYVLIFKCPILVIMLATTGICWIKNRNDFWTKLIHSKTILFYGTSIAAYFFAVAVFPQLRVSWFGELSAIITVVIMWNQFMPQITTRRFSIIKQIIAGSLILLLLAHMITVDIYAYRCNNDHKLITSQYLANPSKTIYHDYTSTQDVPAIAFGKVISSYQWIGEYPLLCFAKYHQTNPQPNVVPSRLIDFSITDSQKIDGNNPFYLYKGALIAPQDSVKWLDRFIIDFRYPVDKSCGLATFPFISNSGDSLVMATSWLIDGKLQYNPINRIDRQ